MTIVVRKRNCAATHPNTCCPPYLLRLAAAADLVLRLVATGQHNDVVVLGRGLQIRII